GHLTRAIGDFRHGVNDSGHGLATTSSDIRRALGEAVGFYSVICVLANGAGQLLHAGSRFLQRRGLLLGAAAEVSIASENFAGAHIDLFDALANHTHRTSQAVLHATQRGIQYADFIARVDLYSLSQVTIGDAVEMLPSLNELTHHSTAEHNTNADHQKEADEHRNTHGDQRAVQGLFCTLEEGGADFCLLGVEVVHCTLEALGTRHTEFVVHEIEGDGVRVLKRLQHRIDSIV